LPHARFIEKTRKAPNFANFSDAEAESLRAFSVPIRLTANIR